MFAPLRYIFAAIVKRGELVVIDHKGATHRFGDGAGPRIVVRIRDRRLEYHLVANPNLAFGEGYMQGRFTLETGTIYDFVALMLNNAEQRPSPLWTDVAHYSRRLFNRLQQLNSLGRSKANVAHHYNIDRAIYELFLDSDKQYSCAYFPKDCSLEDAQLAKKRHLAAKLALTEGQRVLDIGSGWGGLALYLAQTCRVKVTGITLSEEQLKLAEERVDGAGLSRSVRFELTDYRNVRGTFDRIVSVGMFEHVGIGYYGAFFQAVRDLLSDDGVAVVHSIGQFDPPSPTNPFIAKYIFPGGYIPSLSEVLPQIERSGLLVTDVEILRLHYAETLRHWRERFVANWAKAETMNGAEFCRMWEFYLAASEAAFRYQNLMVFQIQLTKRQATLALTRDYMVQEEARLAALENQVLAPAAVNSHGGIVKFRSS